MVLLMILVVYLPASSSAFTGWTVSQTPLTAALANFSLKSGKPTVLKRLQNRLTLGSLTPELLAKTAILFWVAASGSARIFLAIFFRFCLNQIMRNASLQ
jgi:hypothetical protein